MLCKNCKQETKNPKFCSRSCSISYSNQQKPKRKKKPTAICKKCQKGFYRPPNDTKSIYCSVNCRIWDRFYNGEIVCNSTIRPKLIELYGNKCSICNQNSQWNNQDLVMIVDHIDGNPENNMPDNLRLVCPNCDSQLPTYKAKNTGNGRHKRRERYAQGKSY